MSEQIKRDPCPYCGLDAGKGPNAHADRAGCITALKDRELLRRVRLNTFLESNVAEVKNQIGGVIGYNLHLSAEQTKELWDLI